VGSPFKTGGVGTGMPVATQGGLQSARGGRYLLAADAGSDQISVFRVKDDGRLKLVDTEPSHGVAPGSLAVQGSLVYVANTGPVGANYTGFRLDGRGQLHHLRGSTYALPDDAFPGQIVISPNGKHVIGIRSGGTATEPTIGPSLIDSFRIGSHGKLKPVAGSPFASQRIGPIGSAFRPRESNQLFVTNAHDGPGQGSVSVYDVTRKGRLSPIDGSPFANGQTATCWIDITRDGRYAYVVNTASPSMSSYRINRDGTVALVANTPFKNAMTPFDVRLDPKGRFLYVVDAGAARIHAFAVRSGQLTELPGSPFANPAAGAAFGIVVS
jgi:6-phosphogluconolactonase